MKTWFQMYTAVWAAYLTMFLLLVTIGMYAGIADFNSGHWHNQNISACVL